MIYIQLFVNFFVTGALSIGGGLATLPFLYDIADRTGWYTYNDVANMLAVSESTPGAIGINMATYVGYETAGVFGGIMTTVALVTPGIIVILIIAKFLQQFRENRIVDAAFYGLRPASVGLIASIGVTVGQIVLINPGWTVAEGLGSMINYKALLLAAVILFASIKFKRIHPIVFIIFSAVIGIVFSFDGA